MDESVKQRLAWGITGAGHHVRECLEIIQELENVDRFYAQADKRCVPSVEKLKDFSTTNA